MEGPTRSVDLSRLNFTRVANNFFNETADGQFSLQDVNTVNSYLDYVLGKDHDTSTKKVGVLMVCINQPYWQYAYPVIQGIKQFFLPGHETEIMLWSDMGQFPEAKDVNYGCTVFETESVQWPYPTLMRYHLFLAQEEYLKKFDYLFYIDLDMRVVNLVGDEILGNGLTMAAHPMYWLPHNLVPPYEPDEKSTAHIPLPGRVQEKNGKRWFQPLYAAGGFQGGTTPEFIEAMRTMRDNIDKDFDNNYIARWNDESHWNRYLYENPPAVVLDPSYVYPDSMIEQYYVPKVWGRNFIPKIITITKPFSLSKEGGEAAAKMMS